MALDLDRLAQRILGVLIEKEKTVPDGYPLTLNALVSGCNQKSNRDPHMEVEPYEIEGALRALMDEGWVLQVEREGGRSLRYTHQAGDKLAVDEAELAILAELLLRGPQTPGELRSRAARMHPMESPAEVERRLRDLAARPAPYVTQLERRPREHAARWAHLLGRGETQGAAEPSGGLEASPRAPAPGRQAPPPAHRAHADPDLGDRIENLESRLEELERRLDRLEGR